MINQINYLRPVSNCIKPLATVVATFLLGILTGITSNATAGITISNEGTSQIMTADSAKIYEVVDQMPEIDGGLEEVYKQIKYPPMALSSGVEGRVFVKFVVDAQGKVKNPKVLKDIGAGCGQAAIKGIKKVKFKPGRHQGETVSVYYTLPINFQISN